jgi:hypothetical protein
MVQDFLLSRARGGDAGEGEDNEDEEGPADGEATEPDVGNSLTEPVWQTDGKVECPLKVLQACQLIAEYKERHRTTLPALKDLLLLLQALMPRSNRLPRSNYMFRQVSRRVLQRTFDGSPFRRIHLCSNPECAHVYTGVDQDKRVCPKCTKPRYHKPENCPERPARQLRYMGVTNGIKVLLMSKKVGRSIEAFDLQGTLDTPHSMYASGFSEHLCRKFIPHYDLMDPAGRATAKYRFFATGQVCSDENWQVYTQQVNEGKRLPTKLLVVEGGCDGFQPYKRRVWSTWMWGYRLTGVNWQVGNLSQNELITAICEGATEGKAAHIVARLDAAELKDLAPHSAHERTLMDGGTGAP